MAPPVPAKSTRKDSASSGPESRMQSSKNNPSQEATPPITSQRRASKAAAAAGVAGNESSLGEDGSKKMEEKGGDRLLSLECKENIGKNDAMSQTNTDISEDTSEKSGAPSMTASGSTSMDMGQKIDTIKNTPRAASVEKSASRKIPVTSARGNRSSSTRVSAPDESGDIVKTSDRVKVSRRGTPRARRQGATVESGDVQTTITQNEKPTTKNHPSTLRGSRSKGPPSMERSPNSRDRVDSGTLHVNDDTADIKANEGDHDSYEDDEDDGINGHGAFLPIKETGRVSRNCPPSLKSKGRGACGRGTRGGVQGRWRDYLPAGAAAGARTYAAVKERVQQSIQQENKDEIYYTADENTDNTDDSEENTTANNIPTVKNVSNDDSNDNCDALSSSKSQKCPQPWKRSGRGACGGGVQRGVRGRQRGYLPAGASAGARTCAAVRDEVHQQEHNDENACTSDDTDDMDDDDDEDDSNTSANQTLTLKDVSNDEDSGALCLNKSQKFPQPWKRSGRGACRGGVQREVRGRQRDHLPADASAIKSQKQSGRGACGGGVQRGLRGRQRDHLPAGAAAGAQTYAPIRDKVHQQEHNDENSCTSDDTDDKDDDDNDENDSNTSANQTLTLKDVSNDEDSGALCLNKSQKCPRPWKRNWRGACGGGVQRGVRGRQRGHLPAGATASARTCAAVKDRVHQQEHNDENSCTSDDTDDMDDDDEDDSNTSANKTLTLKDVSNDEDSGALYLNKSQKCPQPCKRSGRGACRGGVQREVRGRQRDHLPADESAIKSRKQSGRGACREGVRGAQRGCFPDAAADVCISAAFRGIVDQQEHNDGSDSTGDDIDDNDDDNDGTTTVIKNLTLKGVLKGLIIQKSMQRTVCTVINETMNIILDNLKSDSTFPLCKHLNTGSYYENLKINEPDEFDVMLVLPVVRVYLEEVPDLGGAFYLVKPKRKSELQQFVDREVISPQKIIKDLRNIVKRLLPKLGYEAKLQQVSPGCPAVTIQLKPGDSIKPVSVDLVPAIKVEKSPWPPAAKNISPIADCWLGSKRRSKLFDKSICLVGKTPPKNADGSIEDRAWRISFSEVEKEIVRNHGSQHTCCEKGQEHCCRKECLKLLKRLLEIFKEKYPSLHNNVCSYHAKTAWLHTCATWPNDRAWKLKDRKSCLINLLNYFLNAARDRVLNHFFLSTYNLFDKRFVTPRCLTDLSNALQQAIEKLEEGQISEVFPQQQV